MDEGADAELIDDPGAALRVLKDGAHGLVGEEVLFALGADEMEADVVSGVLEAKGPERLGKRESGAEWLEDAEFKDFEEAVDAGDEDGEAILGVEVESSEAAYGIGDFWVEPFGVVDDEDGMGAVLVFVAHEESLRGVKEI